MNQEVQLQNYKDILEYFAILGINTTNETLDISSKGDQSQSFSFQIKDVYPKGQNNPGYLQNLYHWCFPEGVQIYDENGNIIDHATGKKQANQNEKENSKAQMIDKELRKIKIKTASGQSNGEFQKVFLPKSYCLISRLNLLEVHKQFLIFMYKYAIYPQIVQNSASSNSIGNDQAYESIKFTQTQIQNFEKYANNYGYREAQKVAINNKADVIEKGSIVFSVREEFIFNFLFSQLKTLQHRPHINQTKQFSLIMNSREIFTLRNSQNKLFEIENFSYKPLFQKLSIQSIIDLIQGMLLEKQIIIFSKNPSDVIHLCEALFSFIRPLTWNCLYIPFLPTQMLETLHIMVPYIIGIHRNNKDQVLSSVESENKVFLDLDSDYIIQDGLQLPDSLKSQLREQLREKLKNCKDSLKQGSKKDQNLNFMNLILNMKKIFFQFMISLINNYLPFFLFPTDFNYERSVSNEIFDFKAYFRFLDASSQPFYQEFVQKTMIFRSFIEETYKILRQVEVFNRDIREIREEEAPQFLIEFIKEIQKLNSYIQLKSSKKIEVTNVNIYQYPDLLHTLNLEHNIIISNYMQELSKQNVIETKNELLKYLIYFQRDLKKKQNQSPFYPQNIKSMVVPCSPIIEEVEQIPIINLDDIQNEVDKTISMRAEKSKQFIIPKQPYLSEYDPSFTQFTIDGQNQVYEIKEFEDKKSNIQIPQFLKSVSIKQDFENKRSSLSIQECSTNELIIPYPSPNRNQFNSNYANISKEYQSINSQQRLYSDSNTSLERINGYFNSNTHSQNVYVNGGMSQTGSRWNKFEQSTKNTGTSSTSLKRSSRKIFENTISQYSGNCSAIGPRATIGPSNQNNKKYSNSIKQKAKTDMSIEDKTDMDYDLHYQIINNPNQIKEDMLGEDAQDEDFKFFKIEEIPQINKKDKSLSPNRSDIPDENQVDTVPDFFRGELEMKNIVTLNIDQITSCHTFRKKELTLNDKMNRHFTSVQNFTSAANTQRSQKCVTNHNFAFESIEENEYDNEFNHDKSNEEESNSDPLLEIRNHFFQEQLSPAHLGSRFSLSTNHFQITSPTNQGNSYIPPFKNGNSQQYFKMNKVQSPTSTGFTASQNIGFNQGNQFFGNQQSYFRTEENIDSNTSLNTLHNDQRLSTGQIFSQKWKQLNGIQINTQITIDEEDNGQLLLTNGSQIFSQGGLKSPTQRVLSPQGREIALTSGGLFKPQQSFSTHQIQTNQNNNMMQQRIKNNYFHTENVMEEESENLSTEPREKPHTTQPPSRIIFTASSSQSSSYNNDKNRQKTQEKKQEYLKNDNKLVPTIIQEYKNENNQIKDDPAILKDFFSYDVYKSGTVNQIQTKSSNNQVPSNPKSTQIFSKEQVQSTSGNKTNSAISNRLTSILEEEKKAHQKRRGNSSSSNLTLQIQSNRSQSSNFNQLGNNNNLNSNQSNTHQLIFHNKQISQTNRDVKYNIQVSNNNDQKKTKLKIFDSQQTEQAPTQQTQVQKSRESDIQISSNPYPDTYSRNQNQINKNIRTILQSTQRQISQEQSFQTQEKLSTQPASYSVLQSQPCESNILRANNQQVQGKETISHMLQQRRQSKEQSTNIQKSNFVQIVFGGENKQNQSVQQIAQNANPVFPSYQNEKPSKPQLNHGPTVSKTSTIKQISQQNYFFSKNNQCKPTTNQIQNGSNLKQQSYSSKRIF